MPVLLLHPWSQFTRPDCAAWEAPGQLVFQGGPTVPVLLDDSPDDKIWRLQHSVQYADLHLMRGTHIEQAGSGVVQIGAKSPVHVISHQTGALGLALDGAASLTPGDRIVLSDAPAQTSDITVPHHGVLAFAAGTLIATVDGPRRVETLRPGAMLHSALKGAAPLLWTGRREILFARGDTRFRPILLHAGSLGPNCPERDLIVSPQHHIVVAGRDVAARTGHLRALAPAGGLTGLRGVRQMLGKRRITYVSLMLDQPDVLLANGAEAQSFVPTAPALAALCDRQRRAVFDLCPDLLGHSPSQLAAPALPQMTLAQTRALVAERKTDSPALAIAAE